MCLPVWPQNILLAKRLTFFLAITLVLEGCGPPTAEQALEQAFKANPNAQRVEIVKFEGTIAVDGQSPTKPGTKLFIILNDPKNPQDPAKQPKLVGGVDEEGNFFFSTNAARDGVEAGNYVVTFVQLHHRKALFGKRRGTLFEPPDELKNLYNDPDKNAANPQFNVDIKKPGRTDWNFNLAVAGEDPVIAPGPHAITKLDYR
ncbi:MAG TPA: hypothetical protein VGP63_00925 [Planctomycetaceae bacterium]|jgi:hypothetical protein|nr:hypothetical protein [Planctomycetaceae bacterium]